jgi:hypothetical protein
MTPSERTSATATARDHALVGSLLAAALLLRLAYVFTYRLDTDEPQHLHVVWAWTQGLLPYRDVFDNHAPLFHMLVAPLAAALGERADIITWMRMAMIPLSALTVWCTYLLGRELFSRSAGLWAAVLLALCPRFFLTSIEFRADTLWAALWVAALAVLLGGRITRTRSFVVGVLLGADVAVSLKSIMCLVALVLAGAIAAVMVPRPRRVLACPPGAAVVAALAGLLVIPLATTAFFTARGALGAFLYGTIGHNVIPAFGTGPGWAGRLLILAAFAPACWAGARMCVASAPSPSYAARRTVLLLAGVFYVAMLEGAWPLETKQDYQVSFPILQVFVAAVSVGALGWIARSLRLRPSSVLALGALAELAALLHTAPLTAVRTRVEPDLLADVLRLTRPGDPIMDLKGETVFRPRPFYYALESLTRERLRLGLITDTIPERLIATGTCVAVEDSTRFPPRARAFLRDNYVSVGRLRVVGRVLSEPPPTSAIVFDVGVAASYVIVSPTGTVDGDLDGEAYGGPRFLAPGRHVFRTGGSDERLALVWAPAVERGFSPFHGGDTL